jgi:hypothetical protein
MGSLLTKYRQFRTMAQRAKGHPVNTVTDAPCLPFLSDPLSATAVQVAAPEPPSASAASGMASAAGPGWRVGPDVAGVFWSVRRVIRVTPYARYALLPLPWPFLCGPP